MKATKTQAAVLVGINQSLEIQELELPRLKPGQLTIKVLFSGICHSQLLEIRGKKGEDKYLPHTLGHEGSGIVLDIGDGVKKVNPGDPVVLTWIKGSGMDVPSCVYTNHKTSINSGAISTLMTTMVTCESRVVPIAPQMPLREATLLGCAIPTGAGMVLNTAHLKEGERIAIFGVGGIGLSAVLAAKLAGASEIIAVDIVDEKLERARQLGATRLIHAERQDAKSVILETTSGLGVDVAIEAVGRLDTMETAFQAVRDKGGICILAGNLPHGRRISIDPFDLIKGKSLRGSWGGETNPDKDIPQYVDFYLSGRLPLETMITHSYPLRKVNQAFEDLEAGKVGRALIVMEND